MQARQGSTQQAESAEGVARFADRAADWSSRTFGAIAVVVLPIVVIALVALIAINAFDAGEIDADEDPINNLFSSRAVIIPARIVLVFVALYVVISVVALIYRGQWIVKAGPVEASEAVRTLDRDQDHLRAELKNAKENAEKWERQYEEQTTELEGLKRLSDEQTRRLEIIRGRIGQVLKEVD